METPSFKVKAKVSAVFSQEGELTVGSLGWPLMLELQSCLQYRHMPVTVGSSLGVLGTVNSQRIWSPLNNITTREKKYSLLSLGCLRPLTLLKILIRVQRGETF